MKNTVLFVDDNRDLLSFLEESCEEWGFEPLITTSAREALDIIKEHEVHVAVVDLKMPEMSGIELLEKLHSRTPQIVRIMMTGYADVQSAIEAINAGAVFRFLKKPFDYDQMKNMLESALEKYRQDQRRELMVTQLDRVRTQLDETSQDVGHSFAVIHLDKLDGVITLANSAAEELFANGETTLVNHRWADIVDMPAADEFWAQAGKAIENSGLCVTQQEIHTQASREIYRIIVTPDTGEIGGPVSLILRPALHLDLSDSILYSYVQDLEEQAALMDKGLKFLYEMSKKMGMPQNFEELVQTIFSDLRQIIDFDIGLLATLTEREMTIHVRTTFVPGEQHLKYFQKEVNAQIEAEIDKPIVRVPVEMRVRNMDGEEFKGKPDDHPEQIRGEFTVPLYDPEDNFLGLMYLGSCSKTGYSPEEVRVIATFASRIGLVLHIINNIFLFREVKELAIKDSLTGLYNRRYFEEQLGKEIERSLRYENDLSFLIMDLDHFKHVNDTYGHLNGDEILKGIAEIIRNSSRNIDIPVRYGGEEFVVVLPETHLDGAHVIGERIRENVAQHSFPLTGEIASETPEIHITVSIGISHLLDAESSTLESLVEQGDRALYHAKNNGRNQVVDYQSIEAETT